jgi:hypothetical protein
MVIFAMLASVRFGASGEQFKGPAARAGERRQRRLH